MSHSIKIPKTNSRDKWRCSKCQFDNLNFILNCQMCDSPKQRGTKKDLNQTGFKVQMGIQCPNEKCKYFSLFSQDSCKKCNKQLFDVQNKDLFITDQSQLQLIACNHCQFQNDPKNLSCASCDRKIKVKKNLRKSVKNQQAGKYIVGQYKECSKCKAQLRIINFTTKESEFCINCGEKQMSLLAKKLCVFCDTEISPSESATHDFLCQQRKNFFKKQNLIFDRCSTLQYETMIYLQKKCEILHYKNYENLVSRIKDLGYTQKDLQNLHHYIIHYAPIIIHMHCNKYFKYFLSDTHYRNQFQTIKLSGQLPHVTRIEWEDRMFDMKHHDASGFQRVKYGTMNFVNDPKGVQSCVCFGRSYFLLKKHIRDRCTITSMDSSSSSATLGTFRFIFHVMMQLTNAQLISAFQGSKGIEMKSHVITAYKEIQIHGPIQFSKDIERVYICKDEVKYGDAKKEMLQQVKTFCQKHSIDYELFDSDSQSRNAGDVLGRKKSIVSKPAKPRIIDDNKQLSYEDLKKCTSAVKFGFYRGLGGDPLDP